LVLVAVDVRRGVFEGSIDGNIAPALNHGDDIYFFACLQVGEIESVPGATAGGEEGGGVGGFKSGL